MTTVVVYDLNNLDSFLTAASLASIRDIQVSDCRSFLPAADEYLWVGVVPTKRYFQNLPDLDLTKVKNTAIVNICSIKGLDSLAVKSVNYIYGSQENTEPSEDSLEVLMNSYGSRTLLERAMLFYGENPERFAPLIFMIREFYNTTTRLELLHQVAYNAKEAVACLHMPGSIFVPIEYTEENAELCAHAYRMFDIHAKMIIKNRAVTNWVAFQKNSRQKPVLTFYEQNMWWFLRRRLIHADGIFRNVSVASTGSIVTTTAPYYDDLLGSHQVFVY